MKLRRILSMVDSRSSEITNDKLIIQYAEFYPDKTTRKSSIVRFNRDFGYNKHFFKICKSDLIDYFFWLDKSDKICLDTKKSYWTRLCTFIRFLNEYYEESLPKPIVIPSFRIKWSKNHKDPDPNRSTKDIVATIEELKNIENFWFIRNRRNYFIIRILRESGMRCGEARNVDYDKIDSRKIKTKGKTGKVTYFISKELNSKLKYFIEKRRKLRVNTNALFVSQYKRRITNRRIREIFQIARTELKIKKHITPHVYRHTINTLRKTKLNTSLEDRKILLNHKLGDVNSESYTILTDEEKLELYDKNNPYNF